ncbi:MAG: hypothetical protein LBT51_08150 [Fusobacteriaceae bacterium]|jgi:hypothetical protein|nr:hypothetical protein [Fusobacteriaceae bacterium]
MKKFFGLLVIVFLSLPLFGTNSGLGIVSVEDLENTGVSPENIENAKTTIERVSTKYKLLLLEKKQTELEINKLVLEGSEENIEKIFILFDKLGDLDATILKDRLKSQIEIRKFISQEQYIKARELAIDRINKQNMKEN